MYATIFTLAAGGCFWAKQKGIGVVFAIIAVLAFLAAP